MCETCAILTEKLVMSERCVEGLNAQLKAALDEISPLRQELHLAMQMIELMRRRMFGASSDKINPDQQTFDALLQECDMLNGAPAPVQPATEKIEYERKKPSDSFNLNGRVKIPEHLERIDKILDLPDSEKICPVTGKPMIRMGEDITEQLAYKPGHFFAIRYIRPKYVSPDRRAGNGVGVLTASLPDGPIDRCKADVSLLAYIAVSKHGDGLPLNRQAEIFERQGIEIARSTFSDWMLGSAEALNPLYLDLRRTALRVDYINVDETPEPMLERGNGKTVTGRMWVYRTGTGPPMAFFDFTDDKTQERPAGILKDFKGHVQTDASSSFNAVFRLEGVFGIGCWAHLRRRLIDAFNIGVKEAKPFVTLVSILYRIEHRMERLLEEDPRKLSDSAVFMLRRKRAIRVMNRFFKLVGTTPELPKSPLGKALTYARNQEAGLREYINDLRFKPDNNAAENCIRPLVVGRKNHLFVGSRKGGKAAAIFYSLIGTCKMNGIDPYEYLKDVLSRINGHPASRIGELLPVAWKNAREAKPKS
jgi:transposase